MESERSSAEKKLLAAVRNQLKRSRQRELKSLASRYAEADRLRRVSNRAHRRVVESALSRAGVDYKGIERRQRPLVARMNQLSRDAWRKARAEARATKLERKDWLLDHGRRIAEFQRDYPWDTTCVDAAVVDPTLVSQTAPLPGYALSSGAGRNAAKLLMSTGSHSDESNLEEQLATIDFHFTWLCDRNGLAYATALVLPTGAYSLSTLSPWCHTAGRARAALNCWISISVFGSMMPPLYGSLSGPGLDVVASKTDGSDSSGEFKSAAYCDVSSLWTSEVPVKAGEPILVTVTVWVNNRAQGCGRGTLDFATGPLEINVPEACITVRPPRLFP